MLNGFNKSSDVNSHTVIYDFIHNYTQYQFWAVLPIQLHEYISISIIWS